MKRTILTCLVLMAALSAYGQTNSKETAKGETETLSASQPSFKEYFRGYSKKLTYDRFIPPYALEVTFDKTVHVLFPAPISYVDLGSKNILAGKAPTAENVLRVKAAARRFDTETNLSVITEDGSFYAFNVRYADEPEALNVEMKDFLHDGDAVNRPSNALDIYLKELGNESPRMVYMINHSIHKANARHVKHIGSQKFGITYLLKGIYTYNGLLYLHTSLKNESAVPLDIDFIRMKIVDKKVAKRTAMQERVIYPVRAYNHVMRVKGNSTERTVFTIEKLTIPDGKRLVVELFEKNGGRHQSFYIENSDIIHALKLKKLKVK